MAAEEQPDFLAIYEEFAMTEYGETLAESIRYGIYKPESVSKQRWVEILGPDADNLRHLISTYDLTLEFIEATEELQPGELSQRDKVVLSAGAITHDCAESVTTDINFSDKTLEHEANEQAVFHSHIERFFPDSTPEIIALIEKAAEEVVFNRHSRLGRVFNAIERIGYLRVAMRASQNLCDGIDTECHDGLLWLVADTISNHQTTHLIASGRRFPAAHHFLQIHQPELQQTFDVGYSGRLTSFAKFDPERAAIKEAHFDTAQDIWDSWCGEFDKGLS
jgi:hypothetical protein